MTQAVYLLEKRHLRNLKAEEAVRLAELDRAEAEQETATVATEDAAAPLEPGLNDELSAAILGTNTRIRDNEAARSQRRSRPSD